MSLRLLAEADLPLMLAWRNAPEIRFNMYSSREIGETEHRAWFVHMQEDPQLRWHIHLNEDGAPDGVVYFTQYQPQQASAFWGFYLGEHRGSGAGLRLGMDGLDEAFGSLGLHKLNADVIAPNKRSLRFHERLGFRREGFFREHHFDGEKRIDVVRFGMLADEWVVRRPTLVAALAQGGAR